MKIKDLENVIKEENLDGANICNATSLTPYQVVITQEDGKWKVFGTDERAGLYGVISYFDSEEEACEDFIKKLRLRKRLFELQKEIRNKRNNSSNSNLVDKPSNESNYANTICIVAWVICFLVAILITCVTAI